MFHVVTVDRQWPVPHSVDTNDRFVILPRHTLKRRPPTTLEKTSSILHRHIDDDFEQRCVRVFQSTTDRPERDRDCPRHFAGSNPLENLGEILLEALDPKLRAGRLLRYSDEKTCEIAVDADEFEALTVEINVRSLVDPVIAVERRDPRVARPLERCEEIERAWACIRVVFERKLADRTESRPKKPCDDEPEQDDDRSEPCGGAMSRHDESHSTPPIRRSGVNRTSGEDAAKIVTQGSGIGVAIVGRLRQAVSDDGPEISIDITVDIHRRTRQRLDDVAQRDRNARRDVVGKHTECQSIEHHAQRVDVGPRIDAGGVATRLFGAHVGNRPEQLATHCSYVVRRSFFGGIVGESSETEVENSRSTAIIDEHVRRLEITMNDAVRVRMRDGIGNRDESLDESAPVRFSRGGFRSSETTTADEIHDEIGFAVGRLPRLDDTRDAGMFESSESLGLTTKELATARRKRHAGAHDLDGDATSRPRLNRLVDDAHPAFAEETNDLVVADGRRQLAIGDVVVGKHRDGFSYGRHPRGLFGSRREIAVEVGGRAVDPTPNLFVGGVRNHEDVIRRKGIAIFFGVLRDLFPPVDHLRRPAERSAPTRSLTETKEMSIRLPLLVFTLLVAATNFTVGQDYATGSPFDDLRWKGDAPEVEVDGQWYALAAIEGHSCAEILAFCDQRYGSLAGKRFVEDLVEVLAHMGTKAGSTVRLVLVDLETKKKIVIDKAKMSRAKRNRLRDRSRGSDRGRQRIRGGDGYATSSPFDGLRWNGDKPEVRVGDRWYDLVAIDGKSRDEILDFVRTTYVEGLFKKRFAEDLVEVMTRMGAKPGRTVDLELRDLASGKVVKKPKTTMTSAKRRAIGRSLEENRRRSRMPPSPSQSITRTEAQSDLERLRRLIDNYYSYRDLRSIDYRSKIDELSQRLPQTVDVAAFGVDIMKLLAPFGDGHTRLRGSSSILPHGFAPFTVVPHGKRYVAIDASGASYLDDAHPYIHSIDGVEVAKWIDAVRPIVAQTTDGFVRRVAAERLGFIQFARGELGLTKKSTLTVRLMNASAQVTSERELDVTSRRLRGHRPAGHDRKLLPGNIGYLRVASMDSGRRFKQWLADAMRHLRRTKGLVIDVRDNGGGSREALLTLLPYFMVDDAAPVVVNVGAYRLHEDDRADDPNGHLSNRFLYPAAWAGWSRSERRAIQTVAKRFRPDWTLPTGEFSDWHYMVISKKRNPAPFHYEHPVVVLLDAGCFSATDIFLGGYKGIAGVTLMGTTSGGGSGRSRPYSLPNSGLNLRVSSMASFRANGNRYDGKGVAPDVVVEPTLSDIIGKTDTVLAAAVERLKSSTQ